MLHNEERQLFNKITAQLDINRWDDGSICEHDFFLSKEDFPEMYEAKPERRVHEPVEQLSPKGLALMSFIYSQKDNCEAQPIIAATSQDFYKLVGLVAQAPKGLRITVIYQPTTSKNQEHKAAATIEQCDTGVAGLRIVYMDSTNDHRYAVYLAFPLKSDFKGFTQFYMQNNMEKPPKQDEDVSTRSYATFSRQSDGYSCGVIALKDARELNREQNFLDFRMVDADIRTYDFPARYLKVIQSKTFYEHVLKKHRTEVVTRDRRTLQQVYEKHRNAGTSYVQHFGEKYKKYVMDYLSKHKNNPQKVKEDVNKYNASQMTLGELIRRHGPKTVPQLQELPVPEPIKRPIQKAHPAPPPPDLERKASEPLQEIPYYHKTYCPHSDPEYPGWVIYRPLDGVLEAMYASSERIQRMADKYDETKEDKDLLRKIDEFRDKQWKYSKPNLIELNVDQYSCHLKALQAIREFVHSAARSRNTDYQRFFKRNSQQYNYTKSLAIFLYQIEQAGPACKTAVSDALDVPWIAAMNYQQYGKVLCTHLNQAQERSEAHPCVLKI